MKHETFAVLITLGFTACADPGSPKEPDIPGAISAGTSGLGEGGPEGDESGGADDESGEGGGGDGGGDGGGPEINPQDCLLAPVEGRHGYKYWCDGSLELDLEIRGEEGSIALNFGELMGQYAEDPDTYDNPLVMACCGEIAEGQQNCDMPQFNACAFDMVEMGCLSIGPRSNRRDETRCFRIH